MNVSVRNLLSFRAFRTGRIGLEKTFGREHYDIQKSHIKRKAKLNIKNSN